MCAARVTKAGYGVPEVVLRNGFCAVEAVVEGTAYSQSIATLPTACRPTRRLVFNQATDARARVDVYADGQVKWADSGQSNNWVSLAMVFVPDDSQGVELALENDWQHMGGSYGNAMYILKDGVCVSWRRVAEMEGGWKLDMVTLTVAMALG